MIYFPAAVVLVLASLPLPTLAGLAFYGPEVTCVEWMTTGDFLVANCPGNGLRSMSVLDLNRCFAFMEDDTIAAGDDGNFVTRGGCTFEPVLNGHNSTVITCPSHQAGKPDVISSIFLVLDV
ncbi:hypothetical protein G7054_g14208 [Neopestalotiopsis clavispora]|nr:hypothetical protein G7054_g14208 [Neopestalotiopsis clavispora]